MDIIAKKIVQNWRIKKRENGKRGKIEKMFLAGWGGVGIGVDGK